MKPFHALLCTAAALSLGGCYGLYGNDEGQRYAQRWDTITLSAGDAKEVNARTHMIHPWPHGVGDRRIPVEGTRMVRAVDRYNRGVSGTQGQSQGSPGANGSGGQPQGSPPAGAGTP